MKIVKNSCFPKLVKKNFCQIKKDHDGIAPCPRGGSLHVVWCGVLRFLAFFTLNMLEWFNEPCPAGGVRGGCRWRRIQKPEVSCPSISPCLDEAAPRAAGTAFGFIPRHFLQCHDLFAALFPFQESRMRFPSGLHLAANRRKPRLLLGG